MNNGKNNNNGGENTGAAGIIDINHVMKLAKLDLSPKDLEHFGSELNKILGYIDMIKEADISKINGMLNELEYDKLAGVTDLNSQFYKDCRIDECKTDGSFDFAIVKSNAPSFEIQSAGFENGFFVVPQIIE
ncbi:MAG: Asp-tRNA(Asn)/Glu-tRNA(Gln) amidotransferase subunit GatC [bacterium]